MNKPSIDLLKKIKKLAEQGVDGEADNASKILHDLMTKYNISEVDLLDEKIEHHIFKFDNYYGRRLLNQIIYMITNECAHRMVKSSTNRPLNELGVYCTINQKIEIETTYNILFKHFKKELMVFYYAFVQKHNLFPKEEGNDGILPDKKEIEKMLMYMQGIDKQEVYKLLEK